MSNKSALCAMLLVAFVFSTPMSLVAQRKLTKTATVETTVTKDVDYTPTYAPVETTTPGPQSLVTPVIYPHNGNVSCSDLLGDPGFEHMSEPWEFKIDPPVEGTFPLTGSRLLNGMPANANMSLTVDLNGSLVMDSFQLSWNSASNITYLISAVIVKGGNVGTNVYPYPNLSTGDTGPFTVTGAGNAISHLAFCFEPFTAPSAAPASVTGRVIDRYGRGIYGARVQLFSASTGAATSAITNTFGYYRFDDVAVGDFYVMSVAHKRYIFVNGSASFSLDADLAGMDFISSN